MANLDNEVLAAKVEAGEKRLEDLRAMFQIEIDNLKFYITMFFSVFGAAFVIMQVVIALLLIR